MKKSVYIFENVCCGASPSEALVSFLQNRFGDNVEIKAFDLGKERGNLPIPGPLALKLGSAGAKCLPAMVVDGVVVSEGRLPNFMEAVEAVNTGAPVGKTEDAVSKPKKSCC